MRKNAYLFFDWSMTINKLVIDGKLNKDYFHSFVASLNNLEKQGYKVNLLVLSGTSECSAKRTYSVLTSAFEGEKNTMLKGFAFEYGGFLLYDEKVKKYYNKAIVLRNIDQLCKKYGVNRCNDYVLYYNFAFKRVDKNVLNFVDECRNTYADKDFEFYNDKYGKGLDIKNKDLNKHEFVAKYLKDKKVDLLVVGGDSVQDEIMFEKSNFENKYFLGFKAFSTEKPNYILSKKKNILGIIEDINALAERLK